MLEWWLALPDPIRLATYAIGPSLFYAVDFYLKIRLNHDLITNGADLCPVTLSTILSQIFSLSLAKNPDMNIILVLVALLVVIIAVWYFALDIVSDRTRPRGQAHPAPWQWILSYGLSWSLSVLSLIIVFDAVRLSQPATLGG